MCVDGFSKIGVRVGVGLEGSYWDEIWDIECVCTYIL